MSVRHHYIPRFFINGFTNASGFLYVYDKKKDVVFKKPRSPKSIFFEDYLNSFQIDGKDYPLLEELWYADLDSKLSPYVNNLIRKPNNNTTLTDLNISNLHFFIITLFWRIPVTDFAFDYLMANSNITFNLDGKMVQDKAMEDALKSDPVYKKLKRAGVFRELLKNQKERVSGGRRMYVDGLFEFANPEILLGDFPCVYRDLPQTFEGLDNLEFFFPLSATRIFTHLKTGIKNVTLSQIHLMNAIIIDQSVRYVCGPDLTLLEKHVSYYRELRKKDLLKHLRPLLFKPVKIVS